MTTETVPGAKARTDVHARTDVRKTIWAADRGSMT